jgi:hypothetical protein
MNLGLFSGVLSGQQCLRGTNSSGTAAHQWLKHCGAAVWCIGILIVSIAIVSKKSMRCGGSSACNSRCDASANDCSCLHAVIHDPRGPEAFVISLWDTGYEASGESACNAVHKRTRRLISHVGLPGCVAGGRCARYMISVAALWMQLRCIYGLYTLELLALRIQVQTAVAVPEAVICMSTRKKPCCKACTTNQCGSRIYIEATVGLVPGYSLLGMLVCA